MSNTLYDTDFYQWTQAQAAHLRAKEWEALFAWAYPRARKAAAKETGLPLATFPEACPWSLEQVCHEDFFPNA